MRSCFYFVGENTMNTTLDFIIRPLDKNTYSLEVFERDNTQPLASASFEYDVSYMTKFEISQLDSDRKDPSGRLCRLQTYGEKLYRILFVPDIRKIWEDRKKKSDFLFLCLRIAPESVELEMIPWETLHDGAEFIAAGVKTGVSRLPLDIGIQKDLPALPLPLNMLALISCPLDLKEHERLRIESEQEIPPAHACPLS